MTRQSRAGQTPDPSPENRNRTSRSADNVPYAHTTRVRLNSSVTRLVNAPGDMAVFVRGTPACHLSKPKEAASDHTGTNLHRAVLGKRGLCED